MWEGESAPASASPYMWEGESAPVSVSPYKWERVGWCGTRVGTNKRTKKGIVVLTCSVQ
jgi:hypothetical protein